MVVLCERDASSHPYIDQSVLAMPMCSDYFPLPELDGHFLSENSAAQTTSKKLRKKPLGVDYHPSQNAVLCGRGKVCSMSTGNLYLKALVNHYLTPYSNALNKAEKSRIVVAIIDAVHALSGGTFIRFQQGEWWEVDDAFAREKIGSLFRDALFTQYRSSTKAKMAKKAKQRNAGRESETTVLSANSSSPPDLVPQEPVLFEQDRSLLGSTGNASQISLEDSQPHDDTVASSTEQGSCSPAILPSTGTKFFPPPLRGMNRPRLVSLSPTSYRKILPLPESCVPLPPTQARVVEHDYEQCTPTQARKVEQDFEQPDLPDDMLYEIDAISNFLEDCF